MKLSPILLFILLLLLKGCGSSTPPLADMAVENDPQSKASQNLYINEILVCNTHTLIDPDFFAFSGWVELYNPTDQHINLQGYGLSDSLDQIKWIVPKGVIIQPHSYLLFWTDGQDKIQNAIHTNFSLKAKGESIALFDPEGHLLDGFHFPSQFPDLSCSFKNEEIGYMHPTPNTPNQAAMEPSSVTEKPTFSHQGGFYENAFTLELQAPNATIYYTTDGSFPTQNAKIYTKPIPIEHTTVVRARAMEQGKLLSYPKTHTYFINDTSTLPILSLSTDNKYLFDKEVGIYTIGTNGAPTPGCNNTPQKANFFQKWKRPVNIEYFDKKGELGFSIEADLKISGSCSRALPQKSFSISTKSKYEQKRIEYPLFPHKHFTTITDFKLRNGGQDWYGTLLRDAFLQQVIKEDLDVDYQDYRSVVVYINGKYWGIYNIREKKNEDFLAQNHPNINPKKVDILTDRGGINEGDNSDYLQMLSFLEDHSLHDEKNYAYISSRMDIENYIDYIIAESFFANNDWPYTNVRYWREKKNSPKWRWILEDLDLAMGQYFSTIDYNMLERISTTQNTTFRNPPWSTFLFRSLLENENFKTRFKEKYRYFLAHTFQADRMLTLLEDMSNEIKEEIPRHTQRWRESDPHAIQDLQSWEARVEHLKETLLERVESAAMEMESF